MKTHNPRSNSHFIKSQWFGLLAMSVWIFPAHAQPLLRIDFNARGFESSTYTQPGFTSVAMNGSGVQTVPFTRNIGSCSITIAPVGGGYDDRSRTTPLNSGALTQGAIYRDFIFATNTTGGGLDITITGLAPNTYYRLTIWSFDSSSTGNRVSDWSCNGVSVTNGYAFNGAAPPTSDEQYRFAFPTQSDAAGRVLIVARRNPATYDANGNQRPVGVFLNAIQFEREPLTIRHITLTPHTVTLLASPADPSAGYSLHQANSLASAPLDWFLRDDATFSISGTNLTVEFPRGPLPEQYFRIGRY